MKGGRLHSLITGRLYYEDGTTRREARHVIAAIFWRLDTFRLRTRWWDLTPWWTTHQPCGCMTRHRRYREITCLNHALEDLHLDEEESLTTPPRHPKEPSRP